MSVRLLVAAGLTALLAHSPRTFAQTHPLSRTDSALVSRILSAEDRRDSTDRALAEGLGHRDARVQVIARRAIGRIRDPRFAARDSFPVPPAPKMWPEPAWRLRFRALASQKDCGALRAALADSAWPVRLRAADLVSASCTSDTALVATLRRWIDAPGSEAPARARGGVAWQAAAHAILALARIQSDDARPRAARLAASAQWPVRMYAARAFGILHDTARLRSMVRDADDNVKEAAILGLRPLTGHDDDSLYIAALQAEGAQAVRAAAGALEGSTHPEARAAAGAAFERWVARDNASARDARVALLAAAGRPASDDHPPAGTTEIPKEAVALALGAGVRLRVTLAPSSGGGSFVVRMRGDVAPIMAARVLDLVRKRYYDGHTWHRVEPDFVIQGGGPGANEYVGYARYFRDELGTVPHVRGTVGMSTRGHDTGDAQWFVNLRDNLRLGRDYTVFAEVVDGIDVVDGVLEGDTIARIEELPPRLP
ncbi:MAG TPA: peptidylprolyl isomerase [Gemmatimonadaceae bacterium]|nr:peptidylprolyl isomerase [Gemmatimonadaceae bacterium]